MASPTELSSIACVFALPFFSWLVLRAKSFFFKEDPKFVMVLWWKDPFDEVR
jgi:hypothetical protein